MATWAKCFKRFNYFNRQRAQSLLALGVAVGPHVGLDARRAALGGRAPQSLKLGGITNALGHNLTLGVAQNQMRPWKSDALSPPPNLGPFRGVAARKVGIVAAVRHPEFLALPGP